MNTESHFEGGAEKRGDQEHWRHTGAIAMNEEAVRRWLLEEEHKDSEIASVTSANPILGTLISSILHGANHVSAGSQTGNLDSFADQVTSLQSDHRGSTRRSETPPAIEQQHQRAGGISTRKRKARNETPEEREARREAERARKAQSRSSESSEAREARLQKDRERKAAARARARQQASAEQREVNRAQDRLRQRRHRALLDEVQLTTLREQDQERHQQRREALTDRERESQQEYDRERRRRQRQSTPEQEASLRRASERIRKRRERSNMTTEGREARRIADAARQRKSRRDKQAQRRQGRAGATRSEANDVRAVSEQRETRREREARAQWSRILRGKKDMYKVALGYHDNYTHPERHRLPPRTACEHCKAWRWEGEPPGMCCLNGKVYVPPFPEPPEEIKELFHSRRFQLDIRRYNSAFAFTSMGASVRETLRLDHEVMDHPGVYTFRISGMICHRIGGLLPRTEGAQPKFAQLYVFDSTEQERIQARNASTGGSLDLAILEVIDRCLMRYNPLARQFKYAGEILANNGDAYLVLHDRGRSLNERLCSNPALTEIAAVYVLPPGSGQVSHRDLIVYPRDGVRQPFRRVFYTHPRIDALGYPLFHIYGEDGWHLGLRLIDSDKRLTARAYYAYLLQTREGEEVPLILLGGRLTQQYVVDQYVKVEEQRLRYQAEQQVKWRTEVASGLIDAIESDRRIFDESDSRELNPVDPTTLQDGGIEVGYNEEANDDEGNQGRAGRRIILSASFTGGERYMRELYLDSMAIVRVFGKPDLFITITCNPNWPEIKEALLEGQTPADRPELVARVFRLKLKAIVNDIMNGALGIPVARMLTIEFQKRGLPHAHMLIIFADQDKPKDPAEYDLFVSAEIPDRSNTELYDIVTSAMMHGPCGHDNPQAPCTTEDKECKKGFPKAFCDQTRQNHDGYPLYRRRANGRTVQVRGKQLDNRYVVPYNPYLVHKYNCHINVEICSTIASVNLYKYVYKGHDRAVASISRTSNQERNEIQEYLDARYISASESCWRLLDFPLQERSHSVTKLQVHLKDQQTVVYRDDQPLHEVLENSKHTTLLEFFELCRRDPEARDLLYQDVPKYYWWQNKRWCKRSRNIEAVGRMVTCTPNTDRFYLRMVLCYRRGPRSFEDLLTVNGVQHETYLDAARAMGLLADDTEWRLCMQEAISFQMPRQLRQLFAMLLLNGDVANPRELWDAFEFNLREDFHRSHRDAYSLAEDTEQNNRLTAVETMLALKDIDTYLQGGGRNLRDFPSLPQLDQFQHVQDARSRRNRLIEAELSYDRAAMEELVTQSALDALNEDQRAVYDAVVSAVASGQPTHKLFFLDGPGGTGKSHVLQKILATVRLSGKIALAVASSGIAALLLTGGRTVHSTFKVPIQLFETSTCNVSVRSHVAQLLRKTDLIVWDEAPMIHRYALEAINRTLQDIMDNTQPFGGKVLLLSGDFRQTLPVVKRATAAQIIEACIKKSELWPLFRQLRLTINMRVRSAAVPSEAREIEQFTNFLLQIGEGRHETHAELDPDCARIPKDMVFETTDDPDSDLQRLINHTFPDIRQRYQEARYFASRAILTPKNADVEAINNKVLQSIPGQVETYLSVDSVDNDDTGGALHLTDEFLHSLKLGGLPPHELRLKVGTPIILIRNLSTRNGLCNGTRLRVLALRPHCILAKVITGPNEGQEALLPRINCDSSESALPFTLRRRQFPVQIAFAMTINKAQGQTMNHLGLYLPQNVFGHGQLYVALSRVTSRKSVKVLMESPEHVDHDGAFTANVVYRQVIS